MTVATIALTMYIALQVVDAVTTYIAIKKGAYESNKMLAKLATLMQRWTNAKWAWLFVAKVVAVAAGASLFYMQQVEVLIALNMFYVYVAANNIKTIRSSRKVVKNG
jgi:hypothetical protein